jgi:hypothetical protein
MSNLTESVSWTSETLQWPTILVKLQSGCDLSCRLCIEPYTTFRNIVVTVVMLFRMVEVVVNRVRVRGLSKKSKPHFHLPVALLPYQHQNDRTLFLIDPNKEA